MREASRQYGRIRPFMLLLGVAIVALLGLQIVGYLGTEAPPPVLGAVPAFTLTDQTGAEFPSRGLQDKVWIATFIYTTCPGPCPRVVERMRAVDAELGHDPRTRLVSFTVDPATDTPEILEAFGRERLIDPARWVLLTGPTEEIYTLARLGFKLGVDAATTSDLPTSGPVVHSIHAVLVDQRSSIRGYYDTSDPEAIARLLEDTRRLLRDASS